MSVARLIEGLTDAEDVLRAVAPDPTPRDRAVWEAARLHFQNWKPTINLEADNGHDFVNLEEGRVKELMKSLVIQLMDDQDSSSVKPIIAAMVDECRSPEELLFCMITLANFAGESGVKFFK